VKCRKRQHDRPLHESQTASLVAPHTVSLYCIILLRSYDHTIRERSWALYYVCNRFVHIRGYLSWLKLLLFREYAIQCNSVAIHRHSRL